MSNEIQQHPGPEDLAAFVDGLLSPAEKGEIRAHLADCERCYEVVTEVLDLTDEAADEAPVSPVLPSRLAPRSLSEPANENSPPVIPPGRGRWRWIFAAAVAAALVAVLLWHPWSPPRQPSAAFFAVLDKPQEARSSLPQNWTDVLPEYRGVENDVRTAAALYRGGVRLVQFELAWLAGDDRRAVELAGNVAFELERAGMPFFFTTLQQSVAEAGGSDAERGAILADVRAQARMLADLDSLDFLLGQWTEATRLAAMLEIEDYFGLRHPRRDLHRLRQADWPPEIATDLDAIYLELEVDTGTSGTAAACESLHEIAGRL